MTLTQTELRGELLFDAARQREVEIIASEQEVLADGVAFKFDVSALHVGPYEAEVRCAASDVAEQRSAGAGAPRGGECWPLDRWYSGTAMTSPKIPAAPARGRLGRGPSCRRLRTDVLPTAGSLYPMRLRLRLGNRGRRARVAPRALHPGW